MKAILESFIKKIVLIMDYYYDYVIDTLINKKTNEIIVIEINSPVYLLVGSGNFSENQVRMFLIEKIINSRIQFIF